MKFGAEGENIEWIVRCSLGYCDIILDLLSCSD